jgi:hypothetical protein
LDTEEATKVLYALGSTNEQKRSAQKTLLQDELPGIELTPEFIKKAVIDDRRRWLNQHRLFWYLTNFEAVKEKDTEQLLKSLKKFVKGTPFMRDIRSDSPKVKAILDSGVFEFVDLQDFTRTYQGDTPEAKAFLKKCLKNKDDIQTALNILVTKKTSPIALVNKILGKVGLGLEKLAKSKADKRYCLDLDLLNDPDRAKVLKAFELRWQMSQDEIAQKMAEKQAQQTQAQSQESAASPPCYAADIQEESEPEVSVLEQTSEQVTEQVVTGQTTDQIVEQVVTEKTFEPTGSAPVDELIEAFPYCDSRETFAAVIEHYSAEAVDTAILYSSLNIKNQLRKWWDAMCFPMKEFFGEAEQHDQVCAAVT